ncbi:hypothetical protein D1627_07575 [Pontibacter oryzae]|uniref:Uncharacterized protein n=1 Tax=Pontibacter oryzae TaxID=2304593 RepID=A0A399SIB3_9BACT|nr:hypothetical protein D1627_07575 [Pontibacter oryzae]
MVHPYIINTFNALILIIVGLVGYFTQPTSPIIALSLGFLGILLLACSYHLHKHNRFVFHTVTALTLLTGALIIWQIDPETFTWNLRNALFLISGVSCLVAVGVYVGTFIQERRTRDNSIYKEDL